MNHYKGMTANLCLNLLRAHMKISPHSPQIYGVYTKVKECCVSKQAAWLDSDIQAETQGSCLRRG
jgi:hypothetical protein